MKTIYEILRDIRNEFGLSQAYVAKFLGLDESMIVQIELGNRDVSSDELDDLCGLYHLSADYFLGTEQRTLQQSFARGLDDLTEHDQQEIINLIRWRAETSRNYLLGEI